MGFQKPGSFLVALMLRIAYRANLEVLGIFPVAAYNGGGPRNVAKLTLLESVDPQARGLA
jgi:hypothetical protein